MLKAEKLVTLLAYCVVLYCVESSSLTFTFLYHEAHSRFLRFARPVERFGRPGPNAGSHAASQHYHDEHQLIKNDHPYCSDARHQGDDKVEHDEQPGGYDQVEHYDKGLGHHQQVEHDDDALGHDQVELFDGDQHPNEG